MITTADRPERIDSPSGTQPVVTDGRTSQGRRSILLVGMDRLTPPFVAGFEAEGIRTITAETDREAIALTQSHRPNVILVGQGVDGSPLELLHDLRAVHGDGLILFLAPTAETTPALEALVHGADDVVAPPHSVASVILRARILRTRRGEKFSPLHDAERPGRLVVDRLSRTVMDGGQPVSLTGREFELLERLLEANGQVVPREAILKDIWGQAQDNEAVLDATVHRLRRKLERDPGQPSILTTVRGIGYRLAVQQIRLTGDWVTT